jgi:hypothetical protein
VTAVVLAGALVAVAGCLPDTKTAEGRIVHGSPEVLARSGSATLLLKVTSRLVDRGSLASLPAADAGLELTGQVDLRSGRSQYLKSGKPVAVFEGEAAYARRPNALPTDARPWVRVDITEDLQDRVLDPVAVPASLVALAIRPTLLLDALAGALTGSLEEEGPDTVSGVSVQRYAMRVDLTQAFTKSERERYSQRAIDDLTAFFEIIGIEENDLHEGKVWVDGDGLPRRILLELVEEPSRDTDLRVTFDLTLEPQPSSVEISVPKQSSVSKVPQLFQYLQPLVPERAT